MASEARWEVTSMVRTVGVGGMKKVQQMWVKQYLTLVDDKETWVNSSDYVWADVSVDVNDPKYWETQGLNNGN